MRQATFFPALLYLGLSGRAGTVMAQTRPAVNDTASLRTTVQAVIRDFRQRAAASGAALPYAPQIVLQVTPRLIYFNDADSTIVVPWWGGLDPGLQQSFTVLAGDSAAGRRLFLELFNWFLLSHELTHALQVHYARPWHPYSSESEANVGAVAYWLAQGSEHRLQALDTALARALSHLPDPTPVGKSPAAYFDENYDALGADPQAYGYYQLHFIRQAIANRQAATFETLVGRIAKAP